MEKEVQLILVTYTPDKFEAGLFWYHYWEKRIYIYSALRDDKDRRLFIGDLANRNFVKPYLVCDGEIKNGDSYAVFSHGVEDRKNGGHIGRGWSVCTHDGTPKHKLGVLAGGKQIVARPDQIGLKRCYSADINSSEHWLENMDADDINYILSNDGKCKIELDHNDKPEMSHGQVIFTFLE